jgi:hypothetical protein
LPGQLQHPNLVADDLLVSRHFRRLLAPILDIYTQRRHPRYPLPVMCGWPPSRKSFFDEARWKRLQSCVRPIDAVGMTAGPDGFRGSRPNQICGDGPLTELRFLSICRSERRAIMQALASFGRRPPPIRLPRSGTCRRGS